MGKKLESITIEEWKEERVVEMVPGNLTKRQRSKVLVTT